MSPSPKWSRTAAGPLWPLTFSSSGRVTPGKVRQHPRKVARRCLVVPKLGEGHSCRGSHTHYPPGPYRAAAKTLACAPTAGGQGAS